MPNPNEIPRGNTSYVWVLGVTLSPASVANAVTAEQTFTVSGVRAGDFVWVNKPSTQAGLFIGGSRASANGVVAITFGNTTAATITPTAAEIYTVHVARPVNLNAAGTASGLSFA